jgi:Uma2 family endonuclease
MVSNAVAGDLAPRVSLEAWADLDEDEPGELVDGHLVEEEVARHLHETAVTWALVTLHAWAKPRGGKVFGSEHKLGVSASRGRKPDVSMYPPGTRLQADAGFSRVPPRVVVEVVSPTPRDVHRDRVEKLKEYASFGVRFYWLIDPRARLVEVLELGQDGRYAIALSAGEGKPAAPGCEGLVLDLDDLWAEIDALALDEGEESQPANR